MHNANFIIPIYCPERLTIHLEMFKITILVYCLNFTIAFTLFTLINRFSILSIRMKRALFVFLWVYLCAVSNIKNSWYTQNVIKVRNLPTYLILYVCIFTFSLFKFDQWMLTNKSFRELCIATACSCLSLSTFNTYMLLNE